MILGIISCQKGIDGISAEGENPIEVSPVTTSVTTKAPIAGTTFPDTRTLIVSASYHPESGNASNYFSGVTFTKTGTSWSADKLWPNSGSLDLFAYSIDGLSVGSTIYDTLCTDGVKLSIPDNSSVQCDILWGYAGNQKYNGSGNTIIMNHAVSAIAFTAKCNVGYDTTANRGISIQSIVLKSVNNSGTVRMDKDLTCTWSSLGEIKDMTVGGISTGYYVPSTPVNLSEVPFGIGGEGLVVIPQNSTSFEINYTIHNGKDGAGNNIDEPGMSFSYSCEGDWVHGKKYIYALDFSLNDINVAPSVLDWDDGGTTDVDISKKVVATYSMTAESGANKSMPKVKMTAGSRMSIEWGDNTVSSYEAGGTDKELYPKHTFTSDFTGEINIISTISSELLFTAAAPEKALFTVNDSIVVRIMEPEDEIWYTSLDGNKINPAPNNFGANIISNTYSDGKGIIKFDGKVTKIADECFRNNTNLTSVVIPNSVTEIGSYPFQGCTNLNKVIIGSDVNVIFGYAFNNCPSLPKDSYGLQYTSSNPLDNIMCITATDNTISSASILEGTKWIACDCCTYCSNLEELIIPNTVVQIQEYAFVSCGKLKSIVIPNSVERIDDGVFRDCYKLSDITLGTGLKVIDEQVFRNCQAKEIKYLGTKSSFNTISKGAMWSGSAGIIHCSDGDLYLTALICTYPDDVVKYENSPSNKASLISAIITGRDIDTGEHRFTECTNLESVIINPGVSVISQYCFRYDSKLNTVKIPDTVTSIEVNAFDECTGLMTIICEAAVPPTLPSTSFASSFNKVPADARIYVPAASVSAYQTADGWSQRADYIQAIAE